MKHSIYLILLSLLAVPAKGQIDSSLFGSLEPLKIELSYSFKKLKRQKKDADYIPTDMVLWIDSTQKVEGQIGIKKRGNFRRQYCQFSPLKVDFGRGNFSHPWLSSLNSIKLVTTCQYGESFKQYLYHEYFAYLLYQRLTSMSFQVRLAEITYQDTEKDQSYTQYGFFIEDIDDLAARNGCVELEPQYADPRYLDRDQLHLMGLFQYMIGNTDWNIGNLHNLKLIQSTDFSDPKIYPVPYDFDYCGLVDARYAVPPDRLAIEDVRDRYYLGYCLNDDELSRWVSHFLIHKEEMLETYATQQWLNEAERQSSEKYLIEFFNLLESPERIRRVLDATCQVLVSER